MKKLRRLIFMLLTLLFLSNGQETKFANIISTISNIKIKQEITRLQ